MEKSSDSILFAALAIILGLLLGYFLHQLDKKLSPMPPGWPHRDAMQEVRALVSR